MADFAVILEAMERNTQKAQAFGVQTYGVICPSCKGVSLVARSDEVLFVVGSPRRYDPDKPRIVCQHCQAIYVLPRFV